MAQLNFNRFGIKEEDASSFDYILGFDMGHGEISVSYWKMNINSSPDDLQVNGNSQKKDFTLLFQESDGTYKTGEATIGGENGQLFSYFKVKPSRMNELYAGTQKTKKELMQQMLVEILKQVKAKNTNEGLFTGKGLLVVGCPSSPDWLANEADLKYAKIFQDVVGQTGHDLKVIIMPESRASLVKIYKESTGNKEFVKILHDGVIVYDFGSSTLDATSIDFDNNIQNDESIPLGAHLIEELIFKNFCSLNGCTSDDFNSPEAAVLYARRIKEAYYTSISGKCQPLVLELKNGEYPIFPITKENMHRITHVEKVGYSTDTRPFVEGTWASLCRSFLESTKEHWLEKVGKKEFNGLILLTGGASRMGFIEEMAKEVFPKAKVHLDGDPSFCVSRGLAYATNADLQALNLIKTAKERINNSIKGTLPQLREYIASELDKEVYAYVNEKIKDWVENGDTVTLSNMLKDATSHIYDKKDRAARIKSGIQKAMNKYLNQPGVDGLRNVIITTINELFKDVFPGKVSDKSLEKFDISKSEWENAISSVTNMDSITLSDIASHIDLETTVSHALKHNFFTITGGVAAYLLAKVVDFIIGTELADKIDKAFTDNKNKVLPRNKRQEIQNNYQKEKDRNTKLIHNAIKTLSVSSTDAKDGNPSTEDKVIKDIVTNLDGTIDKAINNVSLYF